MLTGVDVTGRSGARSGGVERAGPLHRRRAGLRAHLEFRILGPLEVRSGERPLPLGGPRRRSIVARLLLEPNRVVPPDRLMAAVWGESVPGTAHAALHNHLSRLRLVLGKRLERQPGGYVLHVKQGELDLDRFNEAVAAVRSADAATRAGLLRDALLLWRGPPLEDLAAEPVAALAAHLEELYEAALEERIAAELELGHEGELVAELEALVERHPFRERLWEELIVALYRSSRQAEALDAYRTVRRILVTELGLEPSARLRDLQRAVLRHDARLERGPWDERVAAS